MSTSTIPQGPLTKEEHLALLKLAIAANLTARVEHDRRQEAASRDRPIEFQVFSAADLMGADPNRLHLEDIIDDPVRMGAARATVRSWGSDLFNVLGTKDGMVEIAEEVADLDPPHWGYRINIIDKAWDGVGQDDDRWWA